MKYHTDEQGCRKPVLEDSSGSESGLDYYAQGGVVVDGIAYFTGDQGCSKHWKGEDFPFVVAFDTRTFKKLRVYPFRDTYDSSPLVIENKDGAWLVLAHEYKLERTTAMNRDTAEVMWTSATNQPGAYFFGYSYYLQPDNSKLIFIPCANGLHAMSSETGQDVWWHKVPSTGGITPAVDQENGWVYYQADGKLLKLRAEDGTVLNEAMVPPPHLCISWNTILVNDEHGYHIATYWIDKAEGSWCMALRVYDADLNLTWERSPVAGGKKSTITYAHGLLVMGSGNDRCRYEGTDWKHIPAFSIETGDTLWKCDLSDQEYPSILNVPYADGFFYAETCGAPGKVFRIRASDGILTETIDYGAPVVSCAACIVARGMILSGDLHRDGIVVTVVSEHGTADWPGPFGDPQCNTYAAAESPEANAVPMREVGPQGVVPKVKS